MSELEIESLPLRQKEMVKLMEEDIEELQAFMLICGAHTPEETTLLHQTSYLANTCQSKIDLWKDHLVGIYAVARSYGELVAVSIKLKQVFKQAEPNE